MVAVTEGEELTRRAGGCAVASYAQRNHVTAGRRASQRKATPIRGQTETALITHDTTTPSWTIPVTIQGYPIEFMLDTGSAIDCISMETYYKLPEKPKLFEPFYKNVTTVDGSKTACFGQCDAILYIKGVPFPVALHIMNTGSFQGILGRPFLTTNKVTIQSDTGIVTIPTPANNIIMITRECKFLRQGTPDSGISRRRTGTAAVSDLYLVEETVIPSHTERQAKCYPDQDVLCQKALVEAAPNSATATGVRVALTLVDGTLDTFPVRLLNPTSRSIRLPQGSRIGRLNALRPESAMMMLDLGPEDQAVTRRDPEQIPGEYTPAAILQREVEPGEHPA